MLVRAGPDLNFQEPTEDQDTESTPTKQDYMNTLKEGVLQAPSDAKVCEIGAGIPLSGQCFPACAGIFWRPQSPNLVRCVCFVSHMST